MLEGDDMTIDEFIKLPFNMETGAAAEVMEYNYTFILTWYPRRLLTFYDPGRGDACT